MSIILERVQNVIQDKKNRLVRKKLESHPLIQESIEMKLFYLNGLSLLVYVDDIVSNLERNFLSQLISVFDLGNSVLDIVLKFADDPKEQELKELFDELKNSRIGKFVFIQDVHNILNLNKTTGKKEKELVSYFYELLEFSETEIEKLSNIDASLDYSNFLSTFGISKLSSSEKRTNSNINSKSNDARKGGKYYYDRGYKYEKGKGNINKAIDYYQKAAIKGSYAAMYRLGYLYETKKRDKFTAKYWYELAAEQGNQSAINRLKKL